MMKRTLMTTGLASTMALVAAAQTAPATAMNNPLLQKSKLTFGAPDFNRIQEGDYLPALKEGIRQQREEIQRIVNNKQRPTSGRTQDARNRANAAGNHAVAHRFAKRNHV